MDPVFFIPKEAKLWFVSCFPSFAITSKYCYFVLILVILAHHRSLFLDKNRTEGERPMSTETTMLLYGWRSYHPIWRNQVRHKMFVLELQFFLCCKVNIVLYVHKDVSLFTLHLTLRAHIRP